MVPSNHALSTALRRMTDIEPPYIQGGTVRSYFCSQFFNLVNIVLFSSISLFSLESYSLSGPLLEEEKLLSQVCRTIGRRVPLCSSVVIAKDLVLTAAHCAEPRRVRIQCPITGEKNNQKLAQQDPNYQPKETPEQVAEVDLALIRTQSPFKQTPSMELSPTKEKSLELLKNFSNCRVFGFGHLGHKMGRQGILHGVSLNLKELELKDQKGENILLTNSQVLQKGDSGGPLICRDAKEDKDYLVGISSRVSSKLGKNHFSLVYIEKVEKLLQELERAEKKWFSN